jgi:hypothetical protein
VRLLVPGCAITTPNLAAAIAQVEEERRVWELAGAKGTTSLMAQILDV